IYDGLTNGTAYTFTVAAVNAVGTGAASDQAGPATPATLPGKPTALTATPGVQKANLTWTAPDSGGSPITTYKVTQSLDGGTTYTNANAAVSSTTAVVTGLANGATVTFKVAAITAIGTGEASDPSTAITLPSLPGAPTGLTATQGNASAGLTWTAPASASPITGYTVAWTATGASAGTASVSDGSATSFTVTGLTNGATYTFTLSASTAAGAGPSSDASNAVTPSGPVTAPQNVTATRGDQQISVSWAAPASNGGTAITGYTLTATPGAGSPVTATTGGSATSGTIAGLANGTAYTVSVFATNGAGPGASGTASGTVTPAGLPASPTITNVATDIRQATLTWTDGSANGDAITGHLVEQSTGGAFSASTVTGLTLTGGTVTGLANGGTYSFRVSAINGVGTGAPSTASTSVKLIDVPGPVATFTATPGTLSVALAWTAPTSTGGSAITGYSILVTPLAGTPAPYTLTAAAGDVSLNVPSLENGASYKFGISALNAAGTGTVREVTTALADPPDAPTAVTIAGREPKGMKLSWTAPASNGGSPIIAYTVYQKASTDTSYTASSSTVNLADLTADVQGLSNATSYTFVVSATNNRGEGAQSSPSAAATTPDVPAAPTLTDYGYDVGEADYLWSAGATDPDAPITEFVLFAVPTDDTQDTLFAEVAATSTTAALLGLRNGFEYTIFVVAVNGAGLSAPSNTAVITPLGPPEAPAFISGTTGIRSATLTFHGPWNGGSTIIGWAFAYSTDGVNYTPIDYDTISDMTGATVTATLTGLTDGTTYTFLAEAINIYGNGPPSDPSTPLTTARLPAKPVFAPVVIGDGQLTLGWSDATQEAAHPVTSYTIAEVAAKVAPQTASTTTVTITGLTDGVSYSFTVFGTNDVGDGPSSDASAPASPHIPCGNGRLDPGEDCDASAPDNVFDCDASCHYKPAVCGDGKRQFGEPCDNGAANGAGTGCEFDCTLTQCPNAPAPVTSGDICQVAAAPSGADGSKLFIGTVLASVTNGGHEHDKVLGGGGQVLVDASGNITCAACDCSGAANYAKARVVTCAGAVISPGLINPHDHITYQKGPATNQVPNERFEHRHDWRIGGAGSKYNGHTAINSPSGGSATWGEIRNLIAGATSITGSGGGKGVLRNLDAPSPSGVTSQENLAASSNGDNFDTFPLNDTSGKPTTPNVCVGYSPSGIGVVPLDAAYLPHIGEGIDAW
ncbi:MAG: fibronectin type III domain-containing protein, partial [Deltaproteobacteria bacterium]|nr:fibronectin type III domain-containing protein [Deltaproteobacteria bacterium]